MMAFVLHMLGGYGVVLLIAAALWFTNWLSERFKSGIPVAATASIGAWCIANETVDFEFFLRGFLFVLFVLGMCAFCIAYADERIRREVRDACDLEMIERSLPPFSSEKEARDENSPIDPAIARLIRGSGR